MVGYKKSQNIPTGKILMGERYKVESVKNDFLFCR